MSRNSIIRTLIKNGVPALTIGAGVLACGIGAVQGLALVAASAGAQDSSGGPPEQVIVTSAPPGPQRSAIGAPIVNVSFTRLVHFEDLDLRTDEGQRALRNRISFTARSVCNFLNVMYPATYQGWLTQSSGGSRDCFRSAVSSAEPQLDAAINAARGEYGGH